MSGIKNSLTNIVHIIKDEDLTYCGILYNMNITLEKTDEEPNCKRCLRWATYQGGRSKESEDKS